MKRVVAAFMLACVLLSLGLAAPRTASAALPIPPVGPTLPPILPPFQLDLTAMINKKDVYTVPLYRMKLSIPPYTWRYYTASESQRSYMKAGPWVDDGIAMWVSPVRLPNTYPLYRWVYGGRVCFLTMDPAGAGAASYGFVYSGVVGYVMSPGATPAGGQARIFQHRRSAASQYLSDYYYTTSSGYIGAYYYNTGPKCVAWTNETKLQSVTVTSFASGLTGKATANIQWSTLRPGGVIELLFSKDNGATWTSITKTANDGGHSWTVPNVTAADCRIMARWSETVSSPAAAWAIGPKFGITENVVFLPWVVDVPMFALEILAPSAPSSLTATAATTDDEQVQLSWQDNSANETGFRVERKEEGGTFALLTNVAVDVVSYVDETVEEGQPYVYRVRANGSTTNSEFSNEAGAVYNAPDTPPEDLEPEEPPAPPPAPANLDATKEIGISRDVHLTWTASAGTILGYVVERRTTGDWEQIDDLPGPDTGYLDDELTNPAITEATYRVRAYDEFNQSLPSNEDTVVLGVAPPPDTPGTPDYDGTQSGWAEPELTLAYQAGLTYPGVMYDFGRKITREEFCTIAVKLYEKLTGLAAVPGPDPFDDTDNPDILKAYGLGIVRGVSEHVFAPSNSITRQEICVMIFRALQAAGENTLLPPGAPFPMDDAAQIASWAINEVKFCYHNEIMRGMTPTTIAPLGNTTREQGIVLLYRTYEAFK